MTGRGSRRRKDKGNQKEIAQERISILFDLAVKSAQEKDLGQADYLIGVAREIGKKTNVRIPSNLKRLYCKHCYKFTRASSRSRTRVNSKQNRVEVKCLTCGGNTYYPVKKID